MTQSPPAAAVHTAFLMLIHDRGIRHPDVWHAYLEAQGAAGVALCIHGDAQFERGVYNNMGPLVHDNLLPATRVRVQWGDESMVDATIRALSEVMALHPSARHIVLCSGSDVPLKLVDAARAFLGARKQGKSAFQEMFNGRENTRYIRGCRENCRA